MEHRVKIKSNFRKVAKSIGKITYCTYRLCMYSIGNFQTKRVSIFKGAKKRQIINTDKQN